MSRLRQRMIEAMRQRGYSVRTHQAYLGAISDLARYFHRSPDHLAAGEVRNYFRHLVIERGLSASTCRQYYHAARFLYREVLEWEDFDFAIALPKRPQRLPELLSGAEVAALLAACANPKHRALLATCYGCGLRVSELVNLRVAHIDGERRLLRVEQGKGAKDRLVPIGPSLLEHLRAYWRLYRPSTCLFPSATHPARAVSVSTAQKVFQHARAAAGIDKIGGIHALRHAYATHQLAAGLPLHDLQHYLGHRDLRTTMRYLHWVPNYHAGQVQPDLIGQLPGAVRRG